MKSPIDVAAIEPWTLYGTVAPTVHLSVAKFSRITTFACWPAYVVTEHVLSVESVQHWYESFVEPVLPYPPK